MQIFESIEQVIILYAPTVLLYATQIVDWVVTMKKFKALDVHSQIAPVLASLNKATEQVKGLEAEVKLFIKEKADLTNAVSALADTIKAKDEEIAEIKACLKALSAQNIELEAALRRKVECVVKEPESV